jgi:hypothetical protein
LKDVLRVNIPMNIPLGGEVVQGFQHLL